MEATLQPGTKTLFSIDTGMEICQTGTIKSTISAALIASQQLKPRGSAVGLNAGGDYKMTDVIASRMEIGSFFVEQPVFIESPMQSTLALRFLSRFMVTFDFPNSKIYLKAGADYNRPDDLTNMRRQVGLELVRRDGSIVVDRVRPGSPAAVAGFKAGELFLAIGVSRANETSLFEIRESLTKGGPVTCTVQRGRQIRHLILSRPR